MKNVILLGPPGAGKGTQAKRLEAILRSPHIASGDLLRDIRRQDTPLAQKVQDYMDRGQYVPDDLMNQLVLDRVRQPDARCGFLLDGFPRTEAQAEALDREMAEEGRRLDLALYIKGAEDVLLRRLAGRIICFQCHAIYNLDSKPPRAEGVCDVCGHVLERRKDENPEVVRTRIATFIKQTQPLIQYYRERGILRQVDGNRPMDEVEWTVDNALGLKGVSR